MKIYIAEEMLILGSSLLTVILSGSIVNVRILGLHNMV